MVKRYHGDFSGSGLGFDPYWLQSVAVILFWHILVSQLISCVNLLFFPSSCRAASTRSFKTQDLNTDV